MVDMAVCDPMVGVVAGAHEVVEAVRASVAGGGDPGEALRALEVLARGVEAAVVEVLDTAERREVHRADGHLSVQAWCRATVRWSRREARQRCETLRLARRAPDVLAALGHGLVPVESVRVLARAASNRRVGDAVADAAGGLLADAATLDVESFARLVRRLEHYLDADGAHRTACDAHTQRTAWVATVGDEVVVRAAFGAAQGSVMREVFDRYVSAEFTRDPTRTPAQCRADALHAIFVAAAGGPRCATPTVNVVIDHATFESTLAELATGKPSPIRTPLSAFRCETLDGDPLDRFDAIAAALIGYVRRVVIGSDGVVVGLGRRSRLFRGATREAVWLSHGRRCVYPGCDARHCDIDHRVEWSRAGPTDTTNAVPLCDHHNRWKHDHGYHIHRDTTGTWHTTKPDGTPLTPT